MQDSEDTEKGTHMTKMHGDMGHKSEGTGTWGTYRSGSRECGEHVYVCVCTYICIWREGGRSTDTENAGKLNVGYEEHGDETQAIERAHGAS